MRPLLVPVLALLLAAPSAGAKGKRDPSEDAYQAARHAYYALKDDAARRKFRHNWLNVASRFEAVAHRYPKSSRAPDALYTAAELLSDLSRISMLDEDLRAAISDYEAVAQKYPKDSIADDACLALARIHLDRTQDLGAARKILKRALEVLPRGDARAKLLALKATLPAKPEPRATGKRIAARDVRQSEPALPAPAPAAAPAAPSVSTSAAVPTKPREPKQPEHPLAEAFARATSPAQPLPAAAEKPVTPATAQKDASQKEASRVAPDLSGVNPKEAKARLEAAVDAGGDDVTLAQQLGLKVRKVVIDAGHGGHDSGAMGKRGTKEKDVTLAIATRVGRLLADRGLEVVLTRDDDTFVRLEDRTRIANEAKGDLFISIHCNAAESRKPRGIETFTLNVAADRYSIRLAARENASSEKSISDLQFILADLATKANTEESQRLATRVQKGLVGGLKQSWSGVRDLGTKQALFYVLLGAKMPAILVETSFISHPEEEKRLGSKKYQADVAQAIADGVQGFLADRERLARVD